MSWSLNASGQVPAADPSADPSVPTPDVMATEFALVEELKGVLSKPEYGTVASSFSGHVSGSLHVADA